MCISMQIVLLTNCYTTPHGHRLSLMTFVDYQVASRSGTAGNISKTVCATVSFAAKVNLPFQTMMYKANQSRIGVYIVLSFSAFQTI